MAEQREIAAARLLLLDLERRSRCAGLVAYELEQARKEIEELKAERAEALRWIRDAVGPFPESLIHAVAYLHGRWRGAVEAAEKRTP